MGEDEVCSTCGVSQAELDEFVVTNPYVSFEIPQEFLMVASIIGLIALLGIIFKIGQFLGFFY